MNNHQRPAKKGFAANCQERLSNSRSTCALLTGRRHCDKPCGPRFAEAVHAATIWIPTQTSGGHVKKSRNWHSNLGLEAARGIWWMPTKGARKPSSLALIKLGLVVEPSDLSRFTMGLWLSMVNFDWRMGWFALVFLLVFLFGFRRFSLSTRILKRAPRLAFSCEAIVYDPSRMVDGAVPRAQSKRAPRTSGDPEWVAIRGVCVYFGIARLLTCFGVFSFSSSFLWAFCELFWCFDLNPRFLLKPS